LKINEITSGARIDYVEGKITKLGKSWKYNDQDIVRATLCDDTGNVKISLWGKHSQKFSNDDCICIRDATEKMVSGEKNIVVYDASIAEKIQKQITCKTDITNKIKISKIKDIQEPKINVNVKGKISEKKLGEVNGKKGKQFRAQAKLCDETGVIGITLWDDDAKKYGDGDCISVEDGYAHELYGVINFSAGQHGTVEKIIEDIVCVDQKNEIKFTKITDLKFDEQNTNVQGKLTIAKVTHGPGDPRLEGTLCDDTGSIPVHLWRANATKFSNGSNIQIVSGMVTVLGQPVLSEGNFGTVSLIEKNIDCKELPNKTEFKPAETSVI
jgi:ssDNA-binding replication factor A large subunit